MFRLMLIAMCLLTSSSLLSSQVVRKSIPRSSFVATTDAEFRKIDTNRDGQLITAEVQQYQATAALAQAADASRAVFVALDTDRNGQISSAEWSKLPLTPPRTNAITVMNLDADRDGKVSLREHRHARLANFDRIDTDRDGVVTAAEMEAGGVAR